MKKVALIMILFILIIPSIIKAETCDTDKISISSITIEEKSDNVTELDAANANGRNINLNLSMSEVGDNIKYKVTVKNDSNTDFELNNDSFNINSDYIDYTLEPSDNSSNIIKAKSSKNVFLNVEYKNKVPDEMFSNGTYNDNKNITYQLTSDEIEIKKISNDINNQDTPNNPKTGIQSYTLVFVLTFIISGTIYLCLKKKGHSKILIIAGLSISIPLGVYAAACKCDININSRIEISNAYTGIIYRYSTKAANNNDNIENWTKLNEEITEFTDGYEYVTDLNLINDEFSGHSIYLKHKVEKNFIKESYVCATVDKEYCFTNNFDLNNQLLRELEIYINSTSGFCFFNSREAGCSPNYIRIDTYNGGGTSVQYSTTLFCSINSANKTVCFHD